MAKNGSAPNVLWWLGLAVAICGILIFEGLISIKNFSSFWIEVIAAALFALAALFK